MANYNFVFEMTSTTDPTARLEFNLGNNIGTLWIGNVSVTELKAEDGIDHDMKKSPLADAKMYQNGIQVNGGADYMISMDISGEKAAEVTVRLTGAGGSVYAENTFAYDGSGVQNFEYTYTAAEGIMDSEAVFTLSIPEGTSVEVDNIRMCMVKE